MRNIALALIASFSLLQAAAQKIIISPSNNITESLEVIPGRDVESVAYLKNNSGKTAIIKWVFLNYSGSNNTYEFSMCDIENCYEAGTIVRELSLNDGDSTFMKFGISAKCQAGTATATLRAWIDGDSVASVTTFTYNVSISQGKDCVSAIENNINVAKNVFPNPFGNQLILEFNFPAERKLLLTDISGRIVFEKSINQSIERINTSFLNHGAYLVQILENNRLVYSKNLMK